MFWFVVSSVLVLTASVDPCPIRCQNTCPSVNTCNNANCMSNFENSSLSCLPNTTIYSSPAMTLDGTLLSSSATATCGTYFTTAIPTFTAQQTVELFYDAALLPHFTYRVMYNLLWVGKWSSGNSITCYIDGLLAFNETYGGGANISFSNTCGDSQGGTSKSVYTRRSTGDIAHTLLSLNVTLVASKCGGCNNLPCQCAWFIPQAFVLIKYCDSACLVCNDILYTNCSVCIPTFYLSGTTCQPSCLIGYYINPDLTNFTCLLCDISCTECVGPATNCSVCAPGYIMYAPYFGCFLTCPDGTYNDSSTGQCQTCIQNCSKCTAFPTPCQACNVTWFLYQNDCIDTCPSPLVLNSINNTCQDCDVWCAGVTIKMYVTPGLTGLSPLYIELTFTHPMDFTVFPMQTFQNIQFENSALTLSAFSVNYTVIDSYTYRITLQPLGYSFMFNESVTVITIAYPGSDLTAQDGRPLRNSSYLMTDNLKFTYIKPPEMTKTEGQVVQMFSDMSTQFNSITTQPGIQQFKKFGFFMLGLNSLQITSCLVLINTVLPQNLYEGIRFFASFIFFDVPSWQADSSKDKLFFIPPVKNYTRRVMATELEEFRFRRTGFSSVFILDAYSQLIMIACGYIALGICIFLTKKYKKNSKWTGYLETTLAYFHQISILYFTLTIIFQFMYFDSTNPVRIISLILLILINIYYMVYHVRRFYDFLRYPNVDLTSKEYDHYVIKYGYMLKNLKFMEYDDKASCWNVRNWLRPYNYHTLSYVKKFAMMMAFTCFYYQGFAQPIALVIVQVGEIVRFCLTWPYRHRWRNIYRLVLECILLVIFGLIYFIQLIVYNLIRGADATWATWFFMFGWVAFSLIMVYNFGFLILAFTNLVQTCKFTNRQLMDEARREFYFEKLNQYEENTGIPKLEMIDKYVKKGNLNKRNNEQLPNVDFRIEYYQIEKNNRYYSVQVKAIFQLFMEAQFNYKQGGNNVVPGRQLERIVEVNKESPIYDTVHEIFQKFAQQSTHTVILKTFLTVQQSRYKNKQEIPIEKDKIKQEITMFGGGEPKQTKLSKVLSGFPIAQRLLHSLY